MCHLRWGGGLGALWEHVDNAAIYGKQGGFLGGWVTFIVDKYTCIFIL